MALAAIALSFSLETSAQTDAATSTAIDAALSGSHRWPDPRTEAPKAANGYVSEERVMALAKAAGFERVARSDINRNPKDTHDYKSGVWTLPPDLSVPPGEDKKSISISASWTA